MQRNNRINNVHDLIDLIIDRKVNSDSIVIDATLGNGKDTLKLANKLGTNGKLYGFDIQGVAIANSKNLLIEKDLYDDRINLIMSSHDKVREYVNEKVDFAIMNLGYMPKGDKSIITKPQSTIQFLERTIDILNPGGIIVIVFYTGFPEGKLEAQEVENYLRTISQKEFKVSKHEFINQQNFPPHLVLIERI